MPRGTNTLTPDFAEEEVVVRGTTFRFRELSIGDYDELVKKATTKTTNPITGDEDERIDNGVLLKMMVKRCLISPPLSEEQLARMPMRVMLKLNQTVNRMHYGDEPPSEKAVEEESGGEEESGNA